MMEFDCIHLDGEKWVAYQNFKCEFAKAMAKQLLTVYEITF